MGKGCTCGACGSCKARRGAMAKYMLGVIVIAVLGLLAVELLHANGSAPAQLRMSVLTPSCSEPAAVFVQLADDEPIAGANVDVLLDGRFIERLQTDGNGRFFSVLSGEWCEGEHTVTARYDGDRTRAAAAASIGIAVKGNTQAVQVAESVPGTRLSSLIATLQESIVKIEMPGSRGSGVIIAQENGETIILTNKHVIDPAKILGSVDVITADHAAVHPTAIYVAPNGMDLAVVVLKGTFGTVASFETGKYWVGDDVIALGSPRGIQGSVSKGIVSNFGDDKTKSGYKHDVIQTDTAINKGNSGGGLFLAETGKLIGINTFQMKEAEGLNFAIRIDEFHRLPQYTSWERFK